MLSIVGTGIMKDNFSNLINCVKRLNEVIANDETLGHGFCIGHSYFCNLSKTVSDKELIDIIEFELIPLIKEYWFDEQFKVNEWTFNLRSSIK
jgi:5-methylcytosine-specific restriction protein B